MKPQITPLIFCFFLTLFLAACSDETVRTVEVTRLVPQTIEVTREITPTPRAIQTSTPIPATQITPSNPDLRIDIDPGYFDGLIVLTQYYTLLGHGFYEEAFNLLSTNSRDYPSAKQDYMSMAKISFRSVEIISIEPNYLAVRSQGVAIKPDPTDKKRYVVQIKAWGEGNMSGSVPSGVLQTLFVELIQQDSAWKINTFATAPFID